MIRFTLSQLAAIAHGERQGSDVAIDEVTTDTRKVTAGCLFVALKGERFDAHDFAEQAKAAGAGALLVSRPLACDLPQVIVNDTRQAFGELAAWVRQQVPTRVVALTGSSGKTSVKEMTAAILSQCGNTLYTAGNPEQRYRRPDDAAAADQRASVRGDRTRRQPPGRNRLDRQP